MVYEYMTSMEEVNSIIQGICPYTKLNCPDECMLNNALKCNAYKEAKAVLEDLEESIINGLVI